MVDPLDVGDIEVQDHPNGRCSFVPVLRSWKDLGFEGVVDEDHWETGLEWLGRQDYETITSIMHPAVYEAWRSGALPDSRLITRHYSEGFGWSMRPATLKSFGDEKFATSARDRDIKGWGKLAESAQQRRSTDPRWFRTREHMDQTKAIMQRELRYATGHPWKSKWNGELKLSLDGDYGGMKEWVCSIIIAQDVADLGASDKGWAQGKYHTTLMHELMHSFSPGVNPLNYGPNLEWEEGVVEGMTRMLRPALFEPGTGLPGRNRIPESIWRQVDETHGYNTYIKGLEVARNMQGVDRRDFYTTLFDTPLNDRFNRAFSWDPDDVSGLRRLYDSFGMGKGMEMLRQYGAGDVIDRASVFFGRGMLEQGRAGLGLGPLRAHQESRRAIY